MIEELELLIRIQEIDDLLMEIEADKGDLPAQLSALSSEIENRQTTIKKIEQDIAEARRNQKEFEKTIREAGDRLKKSQGVIFNVKTSREYDAISSEIEQANSQIETAENQLLEYIGREEVLRKSLEEQVTSLAALQEDFTEKKNEMDERLGETQEEEESLSAERSDIVIHLKKPVYNHYDRIRKIREGVAVTQLFDSACGYCFSKIPPQQQVKVRRMEDLNLCEVCGCILVATTNKTV